MELYSLEFNFESSLSKRAQEVITRIKQAKLKQSHSKLLTWLVVEKVVGKSCFKKLIRSR
jgi:hypothetical protein